MFERLRAKIKRIRKLEEEERGGLRIRRAEIVVSPIEGIPSFKLSKEFKRKKLSFKRNFIHPFFPSCGNEIILSKEETTAFLRYFKEKHTIKENKFLKIRIFDEMGARIGSLIYKPLNIDLFEFYSDIILRDGAYMEA